MKSRYNIYIYIIREIFRQMLSLVTIEMFNCNIFLIVSHLLQSLHKSKQLRIFDKKFSCDFRSILFSVNIFSHRNFVYK